MPMLMGDCPACGRSGVAITPDGRCSLRCKGGAILRPWKRSYISDITICVAGIFAERRGLVLQDVLCDWYPLCPINVIETAMLRSLNRGLIEYGVSLRTAWLTDAGREFLKAGTIPRKDQT